MGPEPTAQNPQEKEKQAVQSDTCLWAQHWGSRDKQIPGPQWPAGLAYSASPKPMRDPVS